MRYLINAPYKFRLDDLFFGSPLIAKSRKTILFLFATKGTKAL